MKIYLAGENGKKKILSLYESISRIGCYKDIEPKLPRYRQTDRQIDRQTDRQTDRQIEPMNIYLAGGLSGNLSPLFQRIASKQASKQASGLQELAGQGYHKTDEFLTEATNKMRVFLAGNDGYHKTDEFQLRQLTEGVTKFKDFNILESYYTLRDNEGFMDLLNRCNSFLLDSGAFTFLQGTHKGKIDWDEYVEEYCDLINRHDIKLFFELDIDNIIGLNEVERLRRKIEKLTNKQPIPVWHKNRGKEYFIHMCQEYKYIALGGIAIKEISRNIYEQVFPWFISTAHAYGCKIHGLGYTNIQGLHKYNFDSVDSTAWLYGNRGGYLYKFKENGTIEQIRADGKGRLKPREAALNNFIEWIKFSKYAEKKL